MIPAVPAGQPNPAPIRSIKLAAGESTVLGEMWFTAGNVMSGLLVEPGTFEQPRVYQVRFDTVCWLPGHKRPTGTIEMLVWDGAPKRKAGLLELHEQIKLGMTREQVEAVLGKAVLGAAARANYLGDEYRERAPLSGESPFMPSGIEITYVEGKVTDKSYNHQWLTQTAWGKAVDGVEYGFEFKDHKRRYKIGDQVTFTLKARNTTDKLVSFEQIGITSVSSSAKGAYGATIPHIVDTKGMAIKVRPLFVAGPAPPAPVGKIQLAAKETATLGQVAYLVGPAANSPRIETGPGFYLVRFDTVCWLPGHQRPTGTMEIVVLATD